MEEEITLNLKGFFHIIRKRLKLILLITISCTLVSGILSFFVIKPTYEAQVTVMLGKLQANDKISVNYDDVMMYQNLIKTYAEIAKSTNVTKLASYKLNSQIAPETLQKIVIVTPQPDTQLLQIKATSKDPKEAVDIVNAVLTTFIEECKRTLPTGTDIQAIDEPKFPEQPVKPKKALNVAIALFMGLMASVGLAFLLEHIDSTIKTEEDISRYLNISVAGIIPKHEKLMEKPNIITVKDPKSPFAEAYRTLRTNIQLSSFDKKIQSIVITSSMPEEGKSVTAANLAVVMAESGAKTIIIDCDQRKPILHRVFFVSNQLGISDLLVGNAKLAGAIKNTDIENLSILTSGTRPPNPAELLASSKMKNFIEALKEKFEYIIIDTPPVIAVTDAQILASLSDGCLLVVASSQVEREAVVKTKLLLEKVNANILGVVLNKSEAEKKGYYGDDKDDVYQKKIKNIRNAEFEPQNVPKYKRNASGFDDKTVVLIEDKIMALYIAGIPARDIIEQIENSYEVEMSAEMISNVTNRIFPIIVEWQNRQLEKTYSFVFMDTIQYKVGEDKHIAVKAAYVVLGVNMNGEKEILGIWVGMNESSKFWLSILNNLRNRGVQNVLIFCIDGLDSFKDAIGAVYPFAKIQCCIIHQLRAGINYTHKDKEAFAADLKAVYNATNQYAALENLVSAKEKWAGKYPDAIKSWEENWNNLTTYFAFSEYTRRIIYIANVIENLNSEFTKATNTMLIYPNDKSLIKILYLAAEKVSKKWNQTYPNWDRVTNELNILIQENEK